MFNFGILAVIFVFGGVLVILALPVILDRIFRWRFARRFERLVEANQIVPILTRNVDNTMTRSTLQRKGVTMESLIDAWIGGQMPSSAQEWKPLAAAFISTPDERPVTAAILTSKAQRAEAKLWLRNFYHRRDPVGQSKVQRDALKRRQQQTIAHSDNVVQTSGELRFSTLILMPSKLHPHFQSTEASALMADKGVGRGNFAATALPLTPRMLTGNSERETGKPCSSGSDHGMRSLSAMEIGVSQQNLDQASDILELAVDDDRDGRASLVSLGDEDDFNQMTRMLAARTPVSRHPIMYGRPYAVTRPMYTNPLLPARNRVY